jgi:hypothetical protein
MDVLEEPSSHLTLATREAASEHAVKLFKALEPAHAVHALTESRSRLLIEIESADCETLPPLVNALVRVIELGGRFYGLPSAPKGSLSKAGDHAKPVLPMG